jgi:hypothetical protein
MSTSPPVTNDKGLRELIDKKSSKYLLQQVEQGLTDSTCNAHLQILKGAEADQCCHPYSATDKIIQNVSLREILPVTSTGVRFTRWAGIAQSV